MGVGIGYENFWSCFRSNALKTPQEFCRGEWPGASLPRQYFFFSLNLSTSVLLHILTGNTSEMETNLLTPEI